LEFQIKGTGTLNAVKLVGTKVCMVINPGTQTGNCLIGLSSDGINYLTISKAAPSGGFLRGKKYVVAIEADRDGNFFSTVTIGTQVWMAMAFIGIPRHTVALHASVVIYANRAVLVLGESGTGKSTHAALWLKHIPGCSLLNDDSPLIRIELDENKQLVPFVYGSPWSGKGQCYLNERYPVAAFVRLQQHKINQVTRLSKLGAFIIANITALKIIEEYINAGISVRLTVRGNSMSPLLLDGIDSVMLHPCIATELKPQEIILFRYKGGFMLHRIIRIELIAGQYQVSSITTKGDAQNNTETITPEDVVAVASLPKQTFIRKLYRRMVFTGTRVKIKLARMRSAI